MILCWFSGSSKKTAITSTSYLGLRTYDKSSLPSPPSYAGSLQFLLCEVASDALVPPPLSPSIVWGLDLKSSPSVSFSFFPPSPIENTWTSLLSHLTRKRICSFAFSWILPVGRTRVLWSPFLSSLLFSRLHWYAPSC